MELLPPNYHVLLIENINFTMTIHMLVCDLMFVNLMLMFPLIELNFYD